MVGREDDAKPEIRPRAERRVIHSKNMDAKGLKSRILTKLRVLSAA
jgi:hypothetical protein